MVNEYVVNTHDIEKVKLKPLVKEFPKVCVQCREKSSMKKYQSYFNSWQEWALSVSIQALPAKQFNVTLYILYLIQQDSSFPVIESSFCAINFYHLLLNHANHQWLKICRRQPKELSTIKHVKRKL